MYKLQTIAVIMACRDMAHFLQASLDSILEQSLPVKEIIVIDDASNDSTWEILSRYQIKNKNIRIHRNERSKGAGAARNQAIELSTSDWIAVLDADDVYQRDKLKDQMNLLESCSGAPIVLIGSGCLLIDKDGRNFSKYSYPISNEKLKKNLFEMRKFPPHSSLIYRANELKRIGGFREDLPRAQDYELWLRMAKMGQFCSHSAPLVKIRHHESNLSNVGNNESYTQFEYAFFSNLIHCTDYRVSNNFRDIDGQMKIIRNYLDKLKYNSYREWLREFKSSFNLNDNGFKKIKNLSNLNVKYVVYFLRDRLSRGWLQRKFIRENKFEL